MIAMRESKFLQFMFEKIRYDYYNVSIDEWHNVKISQTKQDDGSYKYQLEINNEIVQEKTNENAQEYDKVRLFIGDKFHPSFPTMKLKNLYIKD